MTMGMRVAGFGFPCGWGSCLGCGFVGGSEFIYYYYIISPPISVYHPQC